MGRTPVTSSGLTSSPVDVREVVVDALDRSACTSPMMFLAP
ncbi:MULTISPECIES: JAB domain-containing protein [unclassified Arthrobacter]|nr:JAB domain-containing protein [Arthrobacter sp. Leaf234]